MSTPDKKANVFRPALFGWVFLLLLAVGLIVESVPTFLQQRRLQQQLVQLKAADARDAAQIDQLDAWRESANAALEQAKADRNSLISMYGECRSPEDFFVVHPDYFVSSYRTTSDGVKLLIYVPTGKFVVAADVTSESDQPDEVPPPFPLEPVRREFELEGGRVYLLQAELADDTSPPSLQIAMTGFEPTVVALPSFQKMGSRTRWPTNLMKAPYFLENDRISGEHKLIDYGFHGRHLGEPNKGEQDDGEWETAWIRIQVTLTGSNPARLPATDRLLHNRLTYRPSYRLSSPFVERLKFRDGWYYEDPK